MATSKSSEEYREEIRRQLLARIDLGEVLPNFRLYQAVKAKAEKRKLQKAIIGYLAALAASEKDNSDEVRERLLKARLNLESIFIDGADLRGYAAPLDQR